MHFGRLLSTALFHTRLLFFASFYPVPVPIQRRQPRQRRLMNDRYLMIRLILFAFSISCHRYS